MIVMTMAITASVNASSFPFVTARASHYRVAIDRRSLRWTLLFLREIAFRSSRFPYGFSLEIRAVLRGSPWAWPSVAYSLFPLLAVVLIALGGAYCFRRRNLAFMRVNGWVAWRLALAHSSWLHLSSHWVGR